MCVLLDTTSAVTSSECIICRLFREEDRVSIEKLADSAGVELHLMSNETEEGMAEVKTAACDKLLQARVDARMAGKKVPTRLPACVTRDESSVLCRGVIFWRRCCCTFTAQVSSQRGLVEPVNGEGGWWASGF